MAKRNNKAERVARYASDLHAAKRQLAAARRALAGVTTPANSATLVDPRWRWAHQLVEDRAVLLRRIAGVVGVGLGSKMTRGTDRLMPCVTVFVGRKLTPATLAKHRRPHLPRTLGTKRRRLPVDVVQVGVLTRTAFTGQSCSVTNGKTRTATIGAPVIDDTTGAPAFLTAMHVSGLSHLTAGGVTLPVRVPSVQVSSGAAVIGELTEGSRIGIDAAKVVLSAPSAVLPEIPGIGRIRGWRPVTFPGDQGTAVMMFGATTQARQDGIIVHPSAVMDGFGLDSAIVVRGLTVAAGDSGAALLDTQHLVLGFLVGATSGGLQIFCPAGLVLQRLGCDIPTKLD